MNIKNNKRRRESVERIEKAFIDFLETKELHQITVSDICKVAGINRSTFYANFLDVYDLADKLKSKLYDDVIILYYDEITSDFGMYDYLKLLRHIKDNQSLYKTFFKLGHDNLNDLWGYNPNLADFYFENKYIDYHIEFFKSGFNAIINMWLERGCKETPEEIDEIIKSEYRGREIP